MTDKAIEAAEIAYANHAGETPWNNGLRSAMAASILDKWQDTLTLLLACGEMTRQEIRTVKAVLKSRAKAIRNMK